MLRYSWVGGKEDIMLISCSDFLFKIKDKQVGHDPESHEQSGEGTGSLFCICTPPIM